MAADLTQVQAESTIGTFLFQGTSAESLTKLCRIKDYPDLGGTPEMIDTTDLECTDETQTPGVRKAASMDFTANYNSDVYDSVAAKANTPGFYEVRFGDQNGTNGVFKFSGQHTIYVVGGGTNAARDMKISIARSSAITKVTHV